MTAARQNVLVIEDEKLMSWTLVSSLVKWGYDAWPAFNGHEAIEALGRSGFDIILLDYQLPDLNGLHLAQRIRKLQPTAAIVMITAFQPNELALDRGLVDGYFNKPLNLQDLHRALKEICQKRARSAVEKQGPQTRQP